MIYDNNPNLIFKKSSKKICKKSPDIIGNTEITSINKYLTKSCKN